MTTDPTRAAEIVERQFQRLDAVIEMLRNGADRSDDPECHPLFPATVAACQILKQQFAVLLQRPTDTARAGEWRCFHCGETFTSESCARKHFGPDEGSIAACVIKAGTEQGLLGALRKAEAELADAWHAIHSESTDAAKAYYAQQSRHQEQMRLAEESGYEKGLADGRELAATPSPVKDETALRGEGWRSDCPKCVASKFACDAHFLASVSRCDRLIEASPDDYWLPIASEIAAAGQEFRHARLLNHQAAHLLAWANIARNAALASTSQPAAAECPFCTGPVPDSPLQKLGAYLADVLDDDRWATAEQYLNAALRQNSAPQPASAETVELAVAAERERCAVIADEMRNRFGSPTGDAYTCGLWDQSVRIAAAIRQSAKGGDA